METSAKNKAAAAEKDKVNKLPVSSMRVATDGAGGKSWVWNHFGKLVFMDKNNKKVNLCDGKVFCRNCLEAAKSTVEECEDKADTDSDPDDDTNHNSKLAFGRFSIKSYAVSVSTGNLTRHLREDHGLDDNSQQKKTPSLKTYFQASPRTSASTNKSSKSMLSRDIALWFCRDLQPFDATHDEGMCDFMKKYGVVGKDDKLPCRTTVSREALSDIYGLMMTHVKDLIAHSGRFGALTFDLWTDGYRRRSYITFTYHYTNAEMKVVKITLTTQVMDEKKTGENIKNVILDLKQRFGLQNKMLYAVTDAGANVKLACRLAGLPNHLCIGHGLHNLIINGALKQCARVDELVKKARMAISALRYRAHELQAEVESAHRELLVTIDNAGEILDTEEQYPLQNEPDDTEPDESFNIDLSKPAPTLKTFTETRWHALLNMLKSLGHNRAGINLILGRINKPDLMFSPGEWCLIEDLVKFLQPFEAVVSILSSEKNASINVALILRSELAECLEDKDDDSLAVVQMKSSMKNQFDRRFPITDLVLAASIMDPRFMNLKMVSEELSRRNQSKTEFLIEIVHAEIKETDVNIASVAVRSSNSSTSSNMSTLAVKHSLSQINNSSMIEQECQAYISTAHPNHVRDDEVLQYWNQRRVQFPWLSALAAKLLCIPATSTPSERVFNVAGLTISARRTKLHPKNVDKIIFIHDNYQLCKTSLLD